MISDSVPTVVRAFINDHIRSIGQLEILLLLYGDAEKWWSAEGIAGELRTSAGSVAAQLEEMASKRLLVRTPDRLLFRYGPVSADLDSAVRETAGCYKDRPVAVATFIYSTPLDEIRGFADAFRIRKRRENGG